MHLSLYLHAQPHTYHSLSPLHISALPILPGSGPMDIFVSFCLFSHPGDKPIIELKLLGHELNLGTNPSVASEPHAVW